jgi:hypothetical protein
MNPRRYLCSQLILLRNNSTAPASNSVVNLEEIWENGAVLESEEAIQEGARVEIRCEKAFFSGDAVHVEKHGYGWRVEVQFSPMTHWKPEEFQPEHLLDLPELRQPQLRQNDPE